MQRKRRRSNHRRTKAGSRVLLLAIGAAAAVAAQSAPAPNPFLRAAGEAPAVLNIAHGGASSLAPQNTLAAGSLAFDLGADVWGVDARLTADGVFVLMHDDTLDRTTDVEDVFPSRAPWRVEEFTLEEIRRLDAGSWFVRDDPFGQIDAGQVDEDALARYRGETVPTLREALELVVERGGLIDIEVKPTERSDLDALARALIDLVEATGATERVMISSFGPDVLRAVRALDPAIPLGTLVIFPPADAVATLSDLGADVYLPSPIGFPDAVLAAVRDAGIGVHVWTYNTESQLERLSDTPGVTGIYTDFPQRLAAILARRTRTGDA